MLHSEMYVRGLNLQNIAYPSLLQPVPIPKIVFSGITMDFNAGLPKSKGIDVVLMVIDRLTKYGHFFPLSHPYIATVVAQLFLNNGYKFQGFPTTILNDRDSTLMSIYW